MKKCLSLLTLMVEKKTKVITEKTEGHYLKVIQNFVLILKHQLLPISLRQVVLQVLTLERSITIRHIQPLTT